MVRRRSGCPNVAGHTHSPVGPAFSKGTGDDLVPLRSIRNERPVHRAFVYGEFTSFAIPCTIGEIRRFPACSVSTCWTSGRVVEATWGTRWIRGQEVKALEAADEALGAAPVVHGAVLAEELGVPGDLVEVARNNVPVLPGPRATKSAYGRGRVAVSR